MGMTLCAIDGDIYTLKIVSKEKIVGRELSADEKAVIAGKVKALMGA